MQENPEKQGLSLWFVALAAVFVICLITAVQLLPAAVIFFPVSDIVGHMITEVYGSRQVRRVIWLGFACNLRAVFPTVAFAGVMPAGVLASAHQRHRFPSQASRGPRYLRP